MEQPFISNNQENKSWLTKEYDKKKNRTVQLGKMAIDYLVREGKPVTLHSIANKTKELDEKGKGIHYNTIRINKELNDHYTKHSSSYKQKQREKKPPKKRKSILTNFEQVTPITNYEYRRKLYMTETKEKLVQRLLEAEEHIAQINIRKLKNVFENFE